MVDRASVFIVVDRASVVDVCLWFLVVNRASVVKMASTGPISFTVVDIASVVNRAYALYSEQKGPLWSTVYNALSKRPISFTMVDKASVVNRAYVVYSG